MQVKWLTLSVDGSWFINQWFSKLRRIVVGELIGWDGINLPCTKVRGDSIFETWKLSTYQCSVNKVGNSSMILIPYLLVFSTPNTSLDEFRSTMFSNVGHLNLKYNNLSYECLPLLLKSCVNVRHLDIWGSNLKILLGCLNECHLLRVLHLNRCEYLEEIRGIPPNLERLSARHCESLSSSSRRMLLSQVCCFTLHYYLIYNLSYIIYIVIYHMLN